MFRKLFRKKELVLFGGLFSGIQTTADDFEEYKVARGLYIEDNWERVKTIFKKDDYGNIHPELRNAIEMTQYGAVGGAFVGGTIYSVRATQEFLSRNDTNIFYTNKDAYRQLNNKNLLGFFKGAWIWAPRMALFLGGFSLFSSCCEVYRNKFGVAENVIGGAAIGSIFRINFGLKGMISGGVVGGVLGTIYGVFTLCMLKLVKSDKMELKFVTYAFSKYREELQNRTRESGDNENIPINTSHIVEHVKNPLTEMLVDTESITEKVEETKKPEISQNTENKK